MTRRQSEKGGVMLEAALTISVFLMMLIGVLDLGQFLYIQQALTERARMAVRVGAVQQLSTTDVTNLVLYGVTSPSEAAGRFFNLSPSNVSVTTPDSGTNAARLVITISGAQFPLYSPLLPRSMSNLRVQVSSPVESP